MLYEKHCHEIFQTYQKAWEEINAVYQELLSVLEKAKSEAGKLETDLKVELASETRALLQLSWHGEKEVKTVLNTAEEAAKSLKLQPIKNAENVLASWGCGSSQCSTCGQKEKELVISSAAYFCQQFHQEIPQGTQMCTYCAQGRAVPYEKLPRFKCTQNADGSLVCPKCSGAIPAGTVTCISCKFVMLQLVPDSIEIVEEPPPPKPAEISMPTQHTWTCVCGYEYNLLEAMKCGRCNTYKPQTQASQQAPNYAALPSPNYAASPSLSAQPLWKCTLCQYEYNVFGQPCTRCEEIRAKQGQLQAVQQGYASQMMSAVPNPNEWMCKCGSRQNQAKCTNCGGWKAANTGIDMPSQPARQSNPSFPAQPQSTQSQMPVFPVKQPPSSPQQPMWKCPNCQISNIMTSDLCGGCNKSRWRNTISIQVSVIMGKWGWVCPTCFIEQPVETNTCTSCGQLSPVGGALVQRRRAPS